MTKAEAVAALELCVLAVQAAERNYILAVEDEHRARRIRSEADQRVGTERNQYQEALNAFREAVFTDAGGGQS